MQQHLQLLDRSTKTVSPESQYTDMIDTLKANMGFPQWPGSAKCHLAPRRGTDWSQIRVSINPRVSNLIVSAVKICKQRLQNVSQLLEDLPRPPTRAWLHSMNPTGGPGLYSPQIKIPCTGFPNIDVYYTKK